MNRTVYSHMNLFNKFLIFKYRFNTFFYRYIYNIVHLNLQRKFSTVIYNNLYMKSLVQLHTSGNIPRRVQSFKC